MLNGPTPSPQELATMLRDARARTLAFAAMLEGEQWLGPRRAELNPPLWEIGHIGWFQELWCLRQGSQRQAALRPGADALYDSSRVAHDARWDLPLPAPAATLADLERVLERVLEKLAGGAADAESAYFVLLAAFHEDMHNEAFACACQLLGYPAPAGLAAPPEAGAGSHPGDVEVAGGEFLMGARLWDGFVFDNEKWAHPVTVPPFRIARAPVTHREFAAFVDDGGYTRPAFWSQAGWAWKEGARAGRPAYWRGEEGAWRLRWFDREVPLPLDAPVLWVNWFEAEAWCRWAGRRLPTEAEWECAAATVPGDPATRRRYPWGDAAPAAGRASLFGAGAGLRDAAACPDGDSGWGCRQMLGNVWEWTQDAFLPYPGFVADPYRDYSAPWFGSHKVLRGGCFATAPRLIRNTWRNFYTPERRDVFAGFRSCAR